MLSFHVKFVQRDRRTDRQNRRTTAKQYAPDLSMKGHNKMKDLLSLCKSGLIPQEFHSYYEQLPCTEMKSDCIPMLVLSDSEFDTHAVFWRGSIKSETNVSWLVKIWEHLGVMYILSYS